MNGEEEALRMFNNGSSYNCAQAVLSVLCEDAGLDKETALKIANGFGGGVRSGNVCGAVSGAIMAIGLKYGFHKEGDFEQKGICYAKTDEFIEAFKKENGSVLCRDLLGFDIQSAEDFKNPEIRKLFSTVCTKMVSSAVRIAEGI